MRYFSDLTKKYYDTEKDCIKAEEEYNKEQERVTNALKKATLEKEKKDKEIQLKKKELAKAIEDAEQEVTEANNVYDAAKEKAREIYAEAKKKADELLDVASAKVKDAEEKKYKAVAEFNRNFGPYTTTITGAKAAELYNNTIKSLNNFWRNFYRF